MNTFDDVDDLVQRNENQRAFWTIDLKDEDKLREWVVDNWDALLRSDMPRVQNIIANMAAYRGVQYKIPTAQSRLNDIDPIAKAPRYSVNLIYDAIEQEVSKLTIYRPNVNCIPTSSDNDDVTTAKIGDDLIEWAFYREKIDRHFEKLQRDKKIIGEAYMIPKWDEARGPMDPDYVEAKRKNGGRVPLIGEDGKQVVGVDGDPLYVDTPLRMGDFYFDHIYSWNIQFQRKAKFEDAEWLIYVEYCDADELKARYPKIADKIKATAIESLVFNPETFDSNDYNNKTEVLTLIHKPSEQLAHGYMAKVTRDVVLECGDLPDYYRAEDESGRASFPIVRLTEIDPPGCQRGYSALDFARQLNNLYSNFTNMMARAIFHGAHMKWMVPRGTAKLESLGNGDTVVQYKGAIPPQLAAPNPVSPALWQGREALRGDFEKTLGFSGVARGAPPPGVKAWHAIQYLDELENEKRNSSIAKHNQAIVDAAGLVLKMIGCKYDNKRIERVIGRNNAGDLKGFEPKSLESIYCIKPQVGSALSRQKSMRVAQIMDIKQTFPALVPDEEVINMMGFGDEEGFRNAATVSVRLAEYENAQLMRSKKVKDPETFENHMVHYGIHRRLLEDKTFALETDESVKKKMYEHVEATEFAMYEISKKNPMYMQMILTRFPDFPVFYDFASLGEPSPMQIAMPPQQQQVAPGGSATPAPMGVDGQTQPISDMATNPMDANAMVEPKPMMEGTI
jgi:hypothetical protein